MKVRKAGSTMLLIGGIFFAVGMVFVIVGVAVLTRSIVFRNSAEKTMATIIQIDTYRSGDDTHHRVWIDYNVDGMTYTGVLGEYSSGMREGQQREIYYSPDDPTIIQSGSFLGEAIFISFGAVFALIGGIFLGIEMKNANLKKRLLREGEQLTGTVTSVVADMSVRINGRHPIKIECEVIDPVSGERYLYSSEGVMNDIHGLEGASVTVYADRDDRSKYYVDIASLVEDYVTENKLHDYR